MDKSLLKNFFIYLTRTFILTLGPLLIFPYASRMLGVDSIGKVQYVQSIASYFQLLATFGITSYGIREGARIRDNREELTKLISELVFLNLLMVFVSTLIYFVAVVQYTKPDLASLYKLFSLYIVFYGFNLDWIFNVTEDFRFITYRTALGFSLSILVLVGFVHSPNDYLPYTIVLLIPYAVSCITNTFFVIREYSLAYPGFHNIFKHIVPISLMFAIIASSSIYSLLDTTMLGVLATTYSVGLYTAASKLARLVSQFIVSLFTVFTPRISYYLGKGDTKQFSNLVIGALRTMCFISIPCVIGFFMYSRQGIIIFSGSEFIQADMATKILSINLFFSSIDGFIGWQILVPMRKEKYVAISTFVGSAVNFVLNILFIPIMGINGAAIATICAEVTVFGILFWFSKNLIEYKKVLDGVVLYSFASLSIIPIALIAKHYLSNPLLMIVIGALVSTVAYISVLLFLNERTVKTISLNLRQYAKRCWKGFSNG